MDDGARLDAVALLAIGRWRAAADGSSATVKTPYRTEIMEPHRSNAADETTKGRKTRRRTFREADHMIARRGSVRSLAVRSFATSAKIQSRKALILAAFCRSSG